MPLHPIGETTNGAVYGGRSPPGHSTELEGSGAARSAELLPNVGGNELCRSCRNILLYRFWYELRGGGEGKSPSSVPCWGGARPPIALRAPTGAPKLTQLQRGTGDGAQHHTDGQETGKSLFCYKSKRQNPTRLEALCTRGGPIPSIPPHRSPVAMEQGVGSS